MPGRIKLRASQLVDKWLDRRGLRIASISPLDRLLAANPDDFTLRGVRFDLTEPWVTADNRWSIYNGAYESAEADIVEATVSSDDSVVELGCGIGFLATLVSKTARSVHCYDANPAMTVATRRTLTRNGASAEIVNALLLRNPSQTECDFFIHNEFWYSSLTPLADSKKVSVPVLDVEKELARCGCTYLIVDIEGGEVDLLPGQLPSSVTKLCLECHPQKCSAESLRAMFSSLHQQGFVLDVTHGGAFGVFYLTR